MGHQVYEVLWPYWCVPHQVIQMEDSKSHVPEGAKHTGFMDRIQSTSSAETIPKAQQSNQCRDSSTTTTLSSNGYETTTLYSP